MLLDGQSMLERDARGEPVTGDTLLVFFNNSKDTHTITMPPWRAGSRWTRLIDTSNPDHNGDTVAPGGSWSMESHSAVVWVELTP
jgi:glycogen operon protein